MAMNERAAAYFQNELTSFFETDVELIDVRNDGLSQLTDFYLRFDLDGRRGCIAVGKDEVFEATVSDIDERAMAHCMFTNRELFQTRNTKQVGRTSVRHLIVTMLSRAI